MDWCEFLAEDELIEIIPLFKYNKQLNLISGDFGPFRPSIPIKVPVWLAFNLQRQNKCTICVPDWIQELPQLQEQQEADSERLVPMPDDQWRELLKLLEQEFQSSVNCSELIERREAILRLSAHQLFRVAKHKEQLFIGDVTLNNATKAELQSVKPLIQKCFQYLQQLRTTLADSQHNKQLSQM
ncbi:DNA replication complex GINS protein PSF2-like [Oppia nitens]|uniref:DNA replication complex GINS protein PSF2-like n=1 Tax=Oppia nitens TaxID=1686743 RepID=UPI0023D97F14|nr:DNA replication complex GINS protein PSF2-like [Oppia nitens]